MLFFRVDLRLERKALIKVENFTFAKIQQHVISFNGLMIIIQRIRGVVNVAQAMDVRRDLQIVQIILAIEILVPIIMKETATQEETQKENVVYVDRKATLKINVLGYRHSIICHDYLFVLFYVYLFYFKFNKMQAYKIFVNIEILSIITFPNNYCNCLYIYSTLFNISYSIRTLF